MKLHFALVLPWLATAALASTASAASRALALDAQGTAVEAGRQLRSATVVGVLAGPLADLSFALGRFEDSVDGPGTVVGVGAAAGLTRVCFVRAGLSRIERDRDADAWSARVGPELRLGPTTLGVQLFRSRRDDGLTTNGALGDLEHALGRRVRALASASFARTRGEPDASAGAVGARWNAVGPLHLSLELGLARDPAGTLSPGAPGAGGVAGLLAGGASGGGASSGASPPRFTGRLGMRILLP